MKGSGTLAIVLAATLSACATGDTGNQAGGNGRAGYDSSNVIDATYFMHARRKPYPNSQWRCLASLADTYVRIEFRGWLSESQDEALARRITADSQTGTGRKATTQAGSTTPVAATGSSAEIIRNDVAVTSGTLKPPERNLIARFFVDKEITQTYIARLRSNNPSIKEVVVPLASFGYESTFKNGEKWGVHLATARMATPYLRVSPDLTFEIAYEVKYSENASLNSAVAVTEAAKILSNTLIPATPLVTTLTSDNFRTTAEAIDKTISRALSHSHAETLTDSQSVGRHLRKPMLVSFLVRDAHDGLRRFGDWRVWVSDPKPSIFSDLKFSSSVWLLEPDQCRKSNPTTAATTASAGAAPGATQGFPDYLTRNPPIPFAYFKQAYADAENRALDSHILGFRIKDQITVRKLISQQDWYSTAMQALGNNGRKQDGYRAICERTMELLMETGFNGHDATASLWALLRSMPAGAAVFSSGEAGRANACTSAVQRMQRLGLPITAPAARPLPDPDSTAGRIRIQQALRDSGQTPGAIDGVFGQRTRAALRAYQTAAGLTATGTADPATLRALFGG